LIHAATRIVGDDTRKGESSCRTEHPSQELRPLHVFDVTPGDGRLGTYWSFRHHETER
jgi:hypothetical protein